MSAATDLRGRGAALTVSRAQALIEARRRRGETYETQAEALGVTDSTLRRIRRGQEPSTYLLREMCTQYGVGADWLLGIDEPNRGQRAIEDVLAEFGLVVSHYDPAETPYDEIKPILTKYADELREMIGGRDDRRA